MRFSKLTMIVSLLVIGIAGCAAPYVADVAGDKLTVGEFEQVYAKNNGGWDAAQKTSMADRQKFLDLYVKFLLKVKEAKAMGYDKDPELLAELSDYRKNLAVSYMLDKQITGPAIEKLYQRKLNEVRASHIMIRLSPTASPKDTLAAYEMCMKIIDSLKMGIPFDTLALHNSQDPSVKNNKGDLYYFSAGMMVPEFEDAVYSLKVGEYTTTPVRTQFGYHIIKVTDIHPNQKAIHVAHIMKRLAPNATAEDSAAAMKKLTEIRDSVMNGGSFSDYAIKNSDDTYSAPRGGDLGFIDRGRTVREFDQEIFSMKDGEISPIIKTQFGLHLIKRFEAQGIKPLKEIEEDLKKEYQRYRFQHDYDKMVDNIKTMYHFSENDSVVKAFAASVDSSATTSDSSWDSTITPDVRSMVMFTFDAKKITVDSVITMAKANQDLKNLSFKLPTTVPTIVDKVGTGAVVEYYALQMESTSPEFSQTMKEYEDGILLFKAEQENVWNKVSPTDSTLQLYYDANHAKYTWPNRVSYQEIYVTSDSAAKIVQKALRGYTVDSLVAKKTKRKSKKIQYETLKIAVAPISFDSAVTLYGKRKANHGISGLEPITTNGLTKIAWESADKDTTAYYPYESGFSFIKVIEKDSAREKTFEEAKSELSGAFQESETNRVENTWYETLRKKYPVTINEEGLKETFVVKPPEAKK
jgi:peptidyl-prolyl cis-trans isomerase SurA